MTEQAGLEWLAGATARAVDWLDRHNGRGELELLLRLGKPAEETGEAWSAWIGFQGQNPRKGVVNTRQDVAHELADVILASLAAAASLGTPVVPAFAPAAPDTTHALLRLTAAVGRLAEAVENGGDRFQCLADVVSQAGSCIGSLGLDPTAVLLEKARRVSARMDA